MNSAELLNNKCFNLDLKLEITVILLISLGKEFHSRGAAYLKVRRP